MFSNQSADAIQLCGRKPFIEAQRKRFKPELADHSLALGMHMLRLIAVETVEKQPVRAGYVSNRGHHAFFDLSPR
jgi:hypothetical protein